MKMFWHWKITGILIYSFNSVSIMAVEHGAERNLHFPVPILSFPVDDPLFFFFASSGPFLAQYSWSASKWAFLNISFIEWASEMREWLLARRQFWLAMVESGDDEFDWDWEEFGDDEEAFVTAKQIGLLFFVLADVRAANILQWLPKWESSESRRDSCKNYKWFLVYILMIIDQFWRMRHFLITLDYSLHFFH